MNGNGGGALITFGLIGLVGWFTEFMTMFAIFAVLGLAMAIVVGVMLLGEAAMCYGGSLSQAKHDGNKQWFADHFLAPLVMMAAVLIFQKQFLDVAVRAATIITNTDNNDPALGLVIGIVGIILVFGSPILAIWAMQSPSFRFRLLSYLGFLIAGVYWGSLAVYYYHHKSFPSVS